MRFFNKSKIGPRRAWGVCLVLAICSFAFLASSCSVPYSNGHNHHKVSANHSAAANANVPAPEPYYESPQEL